MQNMAAGQNSEETTHSLGNADRRNFNSFKTIPSNWKDITGIAGCEDKSAEGLYHRRIFANAILSR